MKRVLNRDGIIALVSLLVWATVVFARTHAFHDLTHDAHRSLAIVVATAAMVVFGAVTYKIWSEWCEEEKDSLDD